MTYSVYSL